MRFDTKNKLQHTFKILYAYSPVLMWGSEREHSGPPMRQTLQTVFATQIRPYVHASIHAYPTVFSSCSDIRTDFACGQAVEFGRWYRNGHDIVLPYDRANPPLRCEPPFHMASQSRTPDGHYCPHPTQTSLPTPDSTGGGKAGGRPFVTHFPHFSRNRANPPTCVPAEFFLPAENSQTTKLRGGGVRPPPPPPTRFTTGWSSVKKAAYFHDKWLSVRLTVSQKTSIVSFSSPHVA